MHWIASPSLSFIKEYHAYEAKCNMARYFLRYGRRGMMKGKRVDSIGNIYYLRANSGGVILNKAEMILR